MLLDAVLADTHYSWLGTEHDKVAYFMNGQLNSDFPKQDLPHIAFGEGDQKTVRYFPDKLPFGRGSNARLVPRRAASGHP